MSKYSEFNFESLSNPDNQLILQNDKKLIGIVGLKNSGKDTMGEYLTKHHLPAHHTKMRHKYLIS